MPVLDKIASFFRSRRKSPTSYTASSNYSFATECGAEYNIVVLGSKGVGKTSIIEQFFYGEHDPQMGKHSPHELHEKTVQIGGLFLKINVLDILGSTKYRTPVLKRGISQADAFILVYSLQQSRGFSLVQDLRDEIVSSRGNDVPIIVVGNKKDLKEGNFQQRKARVESLMGQSLTHNYFETSCKNHNEVCAVFHMATGQAAFGKSYPLNTQPRRLSKDQKARLLSKSVK